MKKNRSLVWGMALSAALSLQAVAGTIVVTSPADSGPGSLREAISDARAGDIILFSPEIARIDLSSGEIFIDKDLEIRGPGARRPEEQLVIEANGSLRIFHVANPAGLVMPAVVLSDLALTGGLVQGENGGAVFNEGALTLLRCSVHGNVASPGPGGGGNGGGVSNGGHSAGRSFHDL